MDKVLNVVDIKILDFEDEDIGLASIASDPHPIVELDAITTSDVEVFDFGGALFARVQISGEIYDPVADIVEGDEADITEVFFDGESIEVTKVADDREQDEVRRPFPFRGEFSAVVTTNLSQGDNIVAIKAVNAVGYEGFDSVHLKADLMLQVQGELSDAKAPEYLLPDLFSMDIDQWPADTVAAYLGDGYEGGEAEHSLDVDPEAPLKFAGTPTELGEATIVLDAPPSFNVGERDTVTIKLDVPGYGMSAPLELIETDIDSRKFMVTRSRFVLGIPPMLDEENLDTVTLALDQNGVVGAPVDLIENAVASKVFEGTHPELGDVSVALSQFGGGTPDVDDTLAVLSASDWGIAQHGLMLRETGAQTGTYEMRTRGYGLGGLEDSGGLRQLVRSLEVYDRDGTGGGVSNSLVVRCGRDAPGEPSASFMGVDFDLVKEDEQTWRFDRPLMVVKKSVPPGLDNVICIADIDDEDTIRVNFCGVPRQFSAAVVSGSEPAEDILKVAPHTSVEVHLSKGNVGKLMTKTDPQFSVGVSIRGTPWTPWDIKDATASKCPAHDACVKLWLNVRAKTQRGIFDVIVREKDGDERAVVKKAFKVVDLRVVVIAIDGADFSQFLSAVDHGDAPSLQEAIGEPVWYRAADGQAERWEFENSVNPGPAVNSFPTITFSSWSTIFTGATPAEQGVVGNSFFPRDMLLGSPLPAFPYMCDNGETLRYKTEGWGVVTRGLDTGGKIGLPTYEIDYPVYLRDGIKTIYEQVAELDAGSVINTASVHAYIGRRELPAAGNRGKHFNMKFPTTALKYAVKDCSESGVPAPGELTARVIDYEWGLLDHGEEIATNLDYWSAKVFVNEVWHKDAPPHLTTVYFPGPDNYAHDTGHGPLFWKYRDLQDTSESLLGVRLHIEKHMDKFFGEVRSRIQKNGWLPATVFCFVGDHGMVGSDNREDENGMTPKFLSVREGTKVEEHEFHNLVGADAKATWVGGNLALADVVLGPNGGMAHIYLKPHVWGAPPSQDDIDELAVRLYQEAIIGYSDSDLLKSLEGALGDRAKGGDPGEQEVLGILVRHPQTAQYAVFHCDPYAAKPIDTVRHKAAAELLTGGTTRKWSIIAKRLQELNDVAAPGTPPTASRPAADAGKSRTGDIVLIMNVKRGFMCTNDTDTDVEPGWHGGPTVAESEVPLIFSNEWIVKSREDNLISKAVSNKLEGRTPRTTDLVPIVKELFRLSRGLE
ncbi:MAG: alkaline phosphatase family protein [Planctomycetota bacterium]